MIAVDWSGRRERPGEAIWLARVTRGRLTELRNGFTRGELVAALIDHARADAETVVGLDFAFSFPQWYCSQRGWATGHDVWRAMRAEAEGLLDVCAPPFWGRPGTRRPTESEQYRRTEQKTGAKSVFQIGGAGAVGTGSLRGMKHLLTLAEGPYAIWPFDEPRLPLVVEIYPRLMTGTVQKGRHRARLDHLQRHFESEDPLLLERAAGSEDAFDAAVSALVMARHVGQLENLRSVPRDFPAAIEGEIWRPDIP